jgi:hypothetical protein
MLDSPITGQIIPSYQASSLGLGFDNNGDVSVSGGFGTSAVGDAIRSAAPVASYGDLTLFGNAVDLFKPTQKNGGSTKKSTDAGGDVMDWWDIAQSHFFTVQIFNDKNGAGIHDANGTPFNFCSGEGTYKNYIPVKSMNFNYTAYDNMSIPLGIFGDFPLLHRKKVTSISFSCYDIDQDAIEKAVKYWEQQCFPKGLYVAYLEDIAAKLSYTSYDVKGRENFTRILYVIPAGSVSVNRSYEENAAKMVNFSVVAVGSPGASATAGDLTGGQGIKERGYGDGYENANRVYETQVSAAFWTGRYRDTNTRNYAD